MNKLVFLSAFVALLLLFGCAQYSKESGSRATSQVGKGSSITTSTTTQNSVSSGANSQSGLSAEDVDVLDTPDFDYASSETIPDAPQ